MQAGLLRIMFRSLFESPHKRARRLAARQGWAVMEKSETAISQDGFVSNAAEVIARDGLGGFIAFYERAFDSKETIGDHARCYALAEPVATLAWDDPEIPLARAKLKLKLYEQTYAETGQSAAAGALYAKALLEIAYLHRGANWLHALSGTGGEYLAQHAELARDVFADTAVRAADCPLWYRARFQCGPSEGCEADELQQRFEDALRFDAAEQGLYIDRAMQLLPRWYGSFAELEAFARRANADAPSELGGSLYARIYCAIARAEHLPDTSADWSCLKDSLEAWYEATRSQHMLNAYAAIADLFGDEDTLARLLETRITSFYPQAWFSAEQAADVFSRLTLRK